MRLVWITHAIERFEDRAVGIDPEDVERAVLDQAASVRNGLFSGCVGDLHFIAERDGVAGVVRVVTISEVPCIQCDPVRGSRRLKRTRDRRRG